MCIYIYIPGQSLSRIIFDLCGFSGAGLKITFGLRVMDSMTQFLVCIYIYMFSPKMPSVLGRWSDILLKLLFQPFCSSWNQRTCAGNNIWVGIQLGEQLNHLGWRGFVWKTRGKPSKMWLKKSQKIPIQMTSWGYWGIAHFQTYPSILQIG